MVSLNMKPCYGQRVANLHHLHDARRVGGQDPAAAQYPRRVRHDPPRFGQVEHETIDLHVVDAVVGVALLDGVALERLFAQEVAHVAHRAVGEIGALFVRGDHRAGAQHGHRQCAAADAGFEARALRDRCRRASTAGRDPSDRSLARRAASSARSRPASGATRCRANRGSSAPWPLRRDR